MEERSERRGSNANRATGSKKTSSPNPLPKSIACSTLTLKSGWTLPMISAALETVRWHSCKGPHDNISGYLLTSPATLAPRSLRFPSRSLRLLLCRLSSGSVSSKDPGLVVSVDPYQGSSTSVPSRDKNEPGGALAPRTGCVETRVPRAASFPLHSPIFPPTPNKEMGKPTRFKTILTSPAASSVAVSPCSAVTFPTIRTVRLVKDSR